MAAILKFRKDTTDTDLLAGTAALARGGWNMRSDEAATEAITLVVVDTNANIIAGAGAIDDLTDVAQRWFNDQMLDDMLWLHAAADGESEKRALVYGISVIHAGPNTSMLGKKGLVIEMTVARGPWENTTEEYTAADAVSAWGGTLDLTTETSYRGNLDGRVYKTKLEGNTSNTGNPITKVWCGVRPKYEGISGFDPTLELESGTLGTDAAVASETGASPNGSTENNKVRVTFSTTTLAKRVSLRIDQGLASGYSAMIGEYLVLLRCKVSSGTTIGVQARTGLSGMTAFAPNMEDYNVSNTAWKLINVGHFRVPVIGFRSEVRDVNYYAVRKSEIQIWCEVITSNGSSDWIDLDAVVLIPAHHFASVSGVSLQEDGGVADYTLLLVYPDGQTQAISYVDAVPSAAVEVHFNRWRLTTDPGILVIAGERAAGHVLTDTIDVEYHYYPRWRTYRLR